MLSKEEWMREAEKSAAHAWGEEHKGLFAFRRLWAAPLAIVSVVVALALGARWLWGKASDAFGTDVSVGTPPAFWMLAGLLLLATAIAFRPRTLPTPAHLLIVKGLVFAALWLFLAAYGIALWF